MKKIVFILLSMFLYGCGTLTTLKDPCPYIGTRYDYNMVAGNFYDGVGFKHMTRPLFYRLAFICCGRYRIVTDQYSSLLSIR